MELSKKNIDHNGGENQWTNINQLSNMIPFIGNKEVVTKEKLQEVIKESDIQIISDEELTVEGINTMMEKTVTKIKKQPDNIDFELELGFKIKFISYLIGFEQKNNNVSKSTLIQKVTQILKLPDDKFKKDMAIHYLLGIKDNKKTSSKKYDRLIGTFIYYEQNQQNEKKLEKIVEKLEIHNEKLEQYLINYGDKKENLETNAKKLQTNAKKIKLTLQKCDEQIQILEKKAEDLDKKNIKEKAENIKKTVEEKKTMEEKAQNINSLLKNCDGLKQTLKKKAEDLDKNITDCYKEKETLKKNIFENKTRYDTKYKHLRREVETLEESLIECDKNKKKLEENNEDYTKEKIQILEENKELKNTINMINKNKVKENDKCDKLLKENEKLEAALNEIKENKAKENDKCDKLLKENEKLEAALNEPIDIKKYIRVLEKNKKLEATLNKEY